MMQVDSKLVPVYFWMLNGTEVPAAADPNLLGCFRHFLRRDYSDESKPERYPCFSVNRLLVIDVISSLFPKLPYYLCNFECPDVSNVDWLSKHVTFCHLDHGTCAEQLRSHFA
jgi:tRNA pseudouridine-54 N-methylase